MKGKATIQIIKNGQVIEEVKEENTITNAARNLLFLNNFGFPFSVYNDNANLSKPINMYSPINTHMFGGILLFSNRKEGSNLVNEILPDAADFQGYLGNAGGDFSGQSKFRGSLNLSESGEISGGYKWVWDFGTDVTNLDGKTINRICLTSRDGGDAGLFKDNADTTKTSIFTNYSRTGMNRSSYIGMYGQFNGSNYFIPYSKLSNDGYYLCNVSENEFVTVKRADDVSYSYTFKRFRFKTELGLNYDIAQVTDTSAYNNLESLAFVELLETKSFTSTVQKGFSTERYIQVISDNTGTYALSITYNKTDKLIYYRKFKLNDTFELVRDSTYIIPDDVIPYISNSKNLVEYNDFIYFIDATNHVLYQISGYNTFNSFEIDKTLGILNTFRGMLIAFSYANYQGGTDIKLKKKVGFWNGLSFDLNDFYYCSNYTSQYYAIFNIQEDIYKKPIFITNGYYGSTYNYPTFNIFTPFFSSINNLSAGITKQSGTTLKIIYEITNN